MYALLVRVGHTAYLLEFLLDTYAEPLLMIVSK